MAKAMKGLKPSMGVNRIYPGGRSTVGWRRGRKLTAVSQIDEGMVLIGVSHDFKAENLYKVVRLRGGEIPHRSPVPPAADIRYASAAIVRYVNPDLTIAGPEQMSITDCDFTDAWMRSREWFVAEPDSISQWRDDCPACGAVGRLAASTVTMAAIGEAVVCGTALEPEGFEIPNLPASLKDASTENEKVMCLACKREFDLDDLKLANA